MLLAKRRCFYVALAGVQLESTRLSANGSRSRTRKRGFKGLGTRLSHLMDQGCSDNPQAQYEWARPSWTLRKRARGRSRDPPLLREDTWSQPPGAAACARVRALHASPKIFLNPTALLLHTSIPYSFVGR